MSMSITSASELDLSLISFVGSDSTLTQQGADKAKRRRQEVCGRGRGALMEAINREMAIIRGNTVLTNFKFPFFRSLCLGSLVHPFQTARGSQNIFLVALYQICIHLNANRVKFEKKDTVPLMKIKWSKLLKQTTLAN